jgi:hypothetical protein
VPITGCPITGKSRYLAIFEFGYRIIGPYRVAIRLRDNKENTSDWSGYRVYSISGPDIVRISNIRRPDIEYPVTAQNGSSKTGFVRISALDCNPFFASLDVRSFWADSKKSCILRVELSVLQSSHYFFATILILKAFAIYHGGRYYHYSLPAVVLPL